MQTTTMCAQCHQNPLWYVCATCYEPTCKECVNEHTCSPGARHGCITTAAKVGQQQQLRVVTSGDKGITIAPGESFLYSYSTSAIHFTKIKLSSGLSFEDVTADQPPYDETPGSSMEHLVQIRTNLTPSTEYITEVYTSPIPSQKLSSVRVTIRVGVGDNSTTESKLPRPSIVFYSIGFIYGDRYRLEFQDTKSGPVATYRNQQEETTADMHLTQDQAATLWGMANRYVRSGVFSAKEPERPRGFDMGYSTVYYKQLTAEPTTLPEIVAYVKQIFPSTRNLSF